MVALNVSSLGYAGTITEITGRDYFNRTGSSLYGVAGAGDLKVTITSGDRMLLAAQGIAWGHNIVDTVASDATIQLDAVASGDRWDTIVLRRDAQTKLTSLHAVKGNSTKALASLTTGGTSHPDQPIALARVTAGSVAVQEVVDLRCWAGPGGVFVKEVLALKYLDIIGSVVSVRRHRYQYIIGENDVLEWLPETPVAMDSGVATITGNGTPQVTRSISYTPGRFTQIPVPVAVTSNPDYYVMIATRPNATSFGVTVTSRNGTNFTGGVGVLWHATGV